METFEDLALELAQKVLHVIDTTDPDSEEFLDSGADSLDLLLELKDGLELLLELKGQL